MAAPGEDLHQAQYRIRRWLAVSDDPALRVVSVLPLGRHRSSRRHNPTPAVLTNNGVRSKLT
jgi:hypothetical protein